jgi:hypothetical protein
LQLRSFWIRILVESLLSKVGYFVSLSQALPKSLLPS